MQLLTCSCKQGSASKRCSCCNSGIKCSDACRCASCQNRSQVPAPTSGVHDLQVPEDIFDSSEGDSDVTGSDMESEAAEQGLDDFSSGEISSGSGY